MTRSEVTPRRNDVAVRNPTVPFDNPLWGAK